jgi:acylphosphatase
MNTVAHLQIHNYHSQNNVSKLTLKVFGRVQGVWYRVNTRQTALKLSLKGFVKNQPDGSVLVVAIGPQEKLEKLKNWCSKGPKNAEVKKIKTKIEKTSKQDLEFTNFEIR